MTAKSWMSGSLTSSSTRPLLSKRSQFGDKCMNAINSPMKNNEAVIHTAKRNIPPCFEYHKEKKCV